MTQRRRDERGAAAVEFGLVVPILLLLVFGIIAYGIYFAQDLSLSNSARQAARYGVVDDRDCEDVIGEARGSADTLAMDGDSTNMSVAVVVAKTEAEAETAAPFCTTPTDDKPCEDSELGDNVYVFMVYPTPELVPMVPVPDQVTGKGVFRCEFS